MPGPPVAYGLSSGKTYRQDHIGDPDALAAMRIEPLIDENGVAVAAVAHKTSPHFRRLGQEVKVKELPRHPRSVQHNECVKVLLAGLQANGNRVEIVTHVFDDATNPRASSVQTLFALRPDSEFRWFCESPIRASDRTVIQPDLTGRPSDRMSPTGRNPAVVIEVIDTHAPHSATLLRLWALSKAAHHIYFYLLNPKKPLLEQYLNGMTVDDSGRVRIRFTYAILNGELIKNGQIQSLKAKSAMGRMQQALKALENARSKA